MKKYLSFILISFSVLGLLFLFAVLIFPLFSSAPEPPSPDAVASRIRTILELPLYEQLYHDVVYIGEEARFFGFRHVDKRLLFSIDIRVEAGIDLIKEKGVRVTPTPHGGLIVSLAEPEILLVDADESTIREYFLKERGGSIRRLDYYDEIDRAKMLVRQQALDRGILELAKEQAKIAVTGLFAPLSPGGIEIRFHQPEVQQ